MPDSVEIRLDFLDRSEVEVLWGVRRLRRLNS